MRKIYTLLFALGFITCYLLALKFELSMWAILFIPLTMGFGALTLLSPLGWDSKQYPTNNKSKDMEIKRTK